MQAYLFLLLFVLLFLLYLDSDSWRETGEAGKRKRGVEGWNRMQAAVVRAQLQYMVPALPGGHPCKLIFVHVFP